MRVAYHETKLALGSDCTLVLVTEEPAEQAQQRLNQLWRTIFQFERQFSRFIPESELSQFNRRAGLAVPVTPAFRAILKRAKELALASDGWYNPFILPALHRAGYVASFVEAYRNDPQPDYAERRVVPAEALEIGDDWARIPFLSAIDLGGCGKGYLADLLAASPAVQGLAGYWLSLGGDIVGAGHDDADRPWRVWVAAATDNQPQAWMEAPAAGFAVATSGPGIRRGQTASGRTWHHLIDPHTLQPAVTSVAMATIVAPTAVEADVLASGVVLVGAERANAYARQQGASSLWLQHGEPVQQCGFGLFQLGEPQEVAYAVAS